MSTLLADITTINADTATLHGIIHGTAAQTVTTEGGVVPTVAKRLSDLGTGTVRGAWTTTTAYALNEIVSSSGLWYRCSTAHTSGTFAADLAAGKWVVAVSPSTILFQVDTIAALKALTTYYDTVYVRGYYAPGDAGGGLFRWNSADTTTDNGGTIIIPNAGGTGRWNRQVATAALSTGG
jgi:hypothetical protein